VSPNTGGTAAEVADAANHPLIRVFTVGQGGGFNDAAPLKDFASIEQQWAVSSPTSIGNGDFSYFSALCYFFARGLQEALGEPTVPIRKGSPADLKM
jgi:sialate O-acetylesterase